jgi:hypothetical protein
MRKEYTTITRDEFDYGRDKMEIPFKGQITQAELVSIYNLAYKGRRWLTYIFGPLFVIFLGIFIYSGGKVTTNGFLLGDLLFSALIAGGVLWEPPISARRIYQNQSEMRGIFSGTIDGEGISLKTILLTQKFKWGDYTKTVRDRNVVVLYQKNGRFNFFPRAWFSSDQDWQKFLSIVDSQVEKGELKEMTGRPDPSLGLKYPGWLVILVIAMVALPAIMDIVTFIMTKVPAAGK